MAHSQKFQRQWEFRKRDSHFYSSSDEREPNSSNEPLFKKHKLISNWMLPKTNEASDNTFSFQQKDRFTPGPGGHFKFEITNKMQTRSSKSIKKEDDPVYNEMRKSPSYKEVNNRKSKSSSHEPATLNNNRIFMESILEELKVARENMLILMREEMRKVMDDDTALRLTVREGSYEQEIVEVQHQNSFKSEFDVRNCNDGSFVRSVKRKKTNSSCDRDKGLGGQADYCQTMGTITSIEKERGDMLGSSVNEPTFSISPSDQIVSSMYLTLPTLLPEARIENQRFNSSLCNYFQEQVARNRMDVNIEKENPTLDSNIHRGFLSSLQQEEKFRNDAHTSSKDLGCMGQNKDTPASSARPRFPIPLHHGSDGAFKIQNQVSLRNLSQDQSNILGLRMNGGGMRLDGESYGLSELHVANDICSHLNSKADGDAWTHGNSIPRSRRGSVIHELVYQG